MVMVDADGPMHAVMNVPVDGQTNQPTLASHDMDGQTNFIKCIRCVCSSPDLRWFSTWKLHHRRTSLSKRSRVCNESPIPINLTLSRKHQCIRWWVWHIYYMELLRMLINARVQRTILNLS